MPDYFTLEELRDLSKMDDESKYPDATCEAAAAYVVAVIERVVGTSFVPRVVTETLDGDAYGSLVLSAPYVRAISSVAVSGQVVDGAALSFRHGILRYIDGRTTWPYGVGNVAVTYVSGYSEEPPADIKEAALQGTRARLLETSSNAKVSDRTSTTSNDAGGTTTYVLAGVDRPTGYPDVDAVIIGYRDTIRVPGVA